jgi:hypothetical protein
MFTFVICVQNTIAKEKEPAKEAIKAKDQATIDAQRTKVKEMIEQRRKTKRTPQSIPPESKKGLDRKRMKRMDQQIEKRKKEHTNFIGELKAAKKLALKENATKTAKKLDEIIKKQQQRFGRTEGNFQKSRDRIRKQFQKENLPAASEKPATESAKEPKEKKTSRWKFWK